MAGSASSSRVLLDRRTLLDQTLLDRTTLLSSVGRSARFRSSDRNRGCLLAHDVRSQALKQDRTVRPGPPKIKILGFAWECFVRHVAMYVGGVGQKELHCAPPLQRAMSLDEFGNGYI
jgi:hypothetical protein